MLKQPTQKRNINQAALMAEKRNIDLLNEALGDIELTAVEEHSLIWLSGWEASTVKHIISAFRKAKEIL